MHFIKDGRDETFPCLQLLKIHKTAVCNAHILNLLNKLTDMRNPCLGLFFFLDTCSDVRTLRGGNMDFLFYINIYYSPNHVLHDERVTNTFKDRTF